MECCFFILLICFKKFAFFFSNKQVRALSLSGWGKRQNKQTNKNSKTKNDQRRENSTTNATHHHPSLPLLLLDRNSSRVECINFHHCLERAHEDLQELSSSPQKNKKSHTSSFSLFSKPHKAMTSIAELFPKCRKIAYDARQQLSQVQNGVLYPSELYFSLDELTRQLDMMNQLVLRETPSQRDMWKRKINELRQDCITLRSQGEQYDRMVNTNVRHQKEREELLTKRKRKRKQQLPTSNEERDLNNLSEEAQSWNQSNYMVNDLLANGEASLSSLVEQRQRLRGVSQFLGQIDDKLGISNSTMRIIERRDITDSYFVLGGCIITCCVIYFVWF